MDIKSTITTLLRDGFVLVFNQDKLDIVRTAESLIGAGVNNMEVTCRISKPLEKLARLRKELPDFAAGAASLIDAPAMLDVYNRANPADRLPSVQQAVDAGACYLVSAVGFRDESYRQFGGRCIMMPGCGSAAEVVDQFSKGANLCKVFPAEQLGGPAFVKAIDAPLHKIISLVPTGGTNPSNIPDYIDAGVLVLGGSFSMIDKATMKEIIDEQDYELLAREFTAVKHQIDTLRAEKYPRTNLPALDEIGSGKRERVPPGPAPRKRADWWRGASVEEISRATGRNFNIAFT
jgi:2-dehydro-3-deoxyphosphogluconate aldolase/(4S)-4-hydroxy-2-oxoglutarate aldolase